MKSTAASARARLSIGEVLEELRPDFPGLNISKIRYLESEGLVEPERTPAGYRKFSRQDVERLRYVLTAQREHYLPLKVIREHLDAMDRGLEPPALPSTGPQVPRVVLAGDGMPSPEAFATGGPELRLSRRELLETAEIGEELLDQLLAFGMVRMRAGSKHFDGDAAVVARTAGELAAYGLEPRHLRAFKTAADREVGLLEQVVAPMRGQRDAGAQARAEDAVRQIAALSVKLHASLVKAGLGTGR
ncbi:MerR family transcriptional regulator [Nocardioides mesophilus]|uniref:MerR family transcriptional regulator n=1 Tax=Nocardioides mesophilus TaxID=433659 RepID=A0A7G9RAS1_9ACTN|nr:MerR family transcriptional regulator [Nocardioides mesophilus]QNN52696.1 MerR family transcriptional regulator [Nocardioides mesophilus]